MISMLGTSDWDVRVKSRMREIRTSGSVRDSYNISDGMMLWHSAYRKSGDNRENKPYLMGVL